jgi:hypothetical protein
MGKKKSSDTEGGDGVLQTPRSRSSRTKPGRASKASVKGSEWWFGQFLDYFEEDSRASVNLLTEWCRKNGRLAHDEPAPSQRTLERWAAKNQWQQRKTSLKLLRPHKLEFERSSQDHERVATYVTRNLRVLCTQWVCVGGG